MKKQLLTLSLFLTVCLGSTALAQQTTGKTDSPDSSNAHYSTLKPDIGDIGFGIKANGLKGLVWENSFDSLTFQIRKVRQRGIIFRADLSISFQNQKFSEKDVFLGGGYSYDEETSKHFAIGLAPGIEKHFPGTRRLDPYVGVALPFVFVGKLRTTEVGDYVDTDGSYLKSETKRTEPGGFGIGLDGFVGLNYYVANRISIGVEYGLGFTLLTSKGKPTYKNIVKSKPTPTAPETVTTTEISDDEIQFRSTFFGNKGVAGLNFIFYLGR